MKSGKTGQVKRKRKRKGNLAVKNYVGKADAFIEHFKIMVVITPLMLLRLLRLLSLSKLLMLLRLSGVINNCDNDLNI